MVYPQVMDDKCLQVDPHDGRTVTGFDWGSPIIRIMAFRGLHRVPYLERYHACWGSSGRPGQCRQLQGQVQSAMGGAGIAKPVYVEHIVSFLGIPASSSSKLKGCVALAIQSFRASAMALQKRHRLVVLRSGLCATRLEVDARAGQPPWRVWMNAKMAAFETDFFLQCLQLCDAENEASGIRLRPEQGLDMQKELSKAKIQIDFWP